MKRHVIYKFMHVFPLNVVYLDWHSKWSQQSCSWFPELHRHYILVYQRFVRFIRRMGYALAEVLTLCCLNW
jgi:hypothetical protein